jgi:predicted metal-dependent phosphoesterase TrpH
LIKVDLHVHSSASFDCSISPDQVVAQCRKRGLSPVFITDHDSIAGAMELQRSEGAEVVIGEEVMTKDGELIGLFLSEAVPSGLDASDAAARIKSQGGLIYLEHPYDPYRRHLSEEAIEKLDDLIDIVEVWNGRSDHRINQKSVQLCETLGAAAGAGSDAHALDDIGSVYVQMEKFDGPQDFLVKLRLGKIIGRRSRFSFK